MTKLEAKLTNLVLAMIPGLSFDTEKERDDFLMRLTELKVQLKAEGVRVIESATSTQTK